MSKMKIAFDIENRGYRIRAYWDEASDAKVTIHKGDELFKEFEYPAYKIFNLAAHFPDIVDGIISDEIEKGFAIAGSDGLGGCVMPQEVGAG